MTTSHSAAQTKSDPEQKDAMDMAVIGICSLAYLLDGIVFTVMGPMAPEVAQALSLSNAQLGPIFSANLIGQCLGLVLFPLVSQRTGHRPIVIGTLIGFGLFQAASGLAASAGQLFWLRLATGFFLGGSLPSCLAMTTAAAPPHRRGLAITILFTGYAIGSTAAGLVPALFVNLGGWRVAMAGVGFVCLAFAAVAWVWLREPRVEQAGSARSPGGAKQSVVAIFRPPYLLGTIALWVLFISMLTLSYCLNSWLPIMLVQVGRDPALAAMSVSIFSFGGIVAALGVGLLIDRFGARPVLGSFLSLAAVLLFAIGQVLATASTGLLLALLVTCGFFALGAYGGVNVVLAGFYAPPVRALGIGVAKSVGRVGTVLAPIMIGLALTAGVAETKVMSLFALPAALAALALMMIAAPKHDMATGAGTAEPKEGS
ncbi:MFS transporter [Sphingobium nicotianae]|uniref:MFS transporter n=1 Tax=Sphingobium nicotianae TaxID=2782607 RepID=A0A9X1DE80_9SPHN|nr:MFS transporter [Sphingobium nicotianae]MBT2188286.1 MFS transporter [Sphingobium nicotianae]